MSAFAYCREHNEITAGVMDLATGFNLGRETNHIGCTVTYLDPAALPRPIAAVVARLAVRPESITDNHVTLLRLCLDLHDYRKEPPCPPAQSTALAAASTSQTSPAPASPSGASMNSPQPSTPTWATSAAEPTLFDLAAS